ncbi:TNMD protein, partial [Panurus biarmicus]|nr:TNMD protein [Panurus biarmicus]
QVYDMEHTFFSYGEKKKIVMEIDPLARTETFSSGNGSEEILEIHDFKNGITGIFFVGLQKCFIKTQTKVLPETTEAKIPELEGQEITTTYFEQSVVWVPGEKPIQNKEFLKSSKIFDICRNVTIFWIHPTPIAGTRSHLLPRRTHEPSHWEQPSALLETGTPKFSSPHEHQSVSRHLHLNHTAGLPPPAAHYTALTEVVASEICWCNYPLSLTHFQPNEPVQKSLLRKLPLLCSYRGTWHHSQVLASSPPLLGYYPYPYCYQGGRVICRIIMPCNWWIARMLGRV